MTELDKLTLNNKIVDMRHAVKQSRIQSINKLVKEIQKLKSKKGTDDQKAKNLSKAERYVEVIHLMKKVKDDDVSKFALLNEKSLPQITNNVQELPEIKAIARIANHRPIYDKVKVFREQFVDWKERLPILFETLGEKHMNKKKKKKPPQKSNENSVAIEKKISNKTENTDPKKKTDVTYIHNRLGTWVVEDIKNPAEVENSKSTNLNERKKQPSVENNAKAATIESKSQPTEKLKIEGDELSESKSRPTKKLKIEGDEEELSESKSRPSKKLKTGADEEESTKSKSSPTEKFKTEVDEKELIDSKSRPTKKLITEADKELLVEKSKKENDVSISEEKPTRTVDPFFVTKDNKEYMSVSVVNNTVNVEENKPHFSSENKFKNPKNSFSKLKPSHEKAWKQNKAHVKKNYPVIEEKKIALHPSWEAKRKQSSLTQFQGKKIKFDD